jgi:signal transduction histidine kinase
VTAQTLHLAGQREEPQDPRVEAVLEVLAGTPRADVARRWCVDVAVLHRWVRDFVAAGSAQVTHRPDPGTARQRDRFLAAFAHEMRSPLATAQGWASMLVDGDVPPDAVGDALARLDRALTTLSARTLDVELLVAASLGRLAPRARPVTLAELVAGLDRPGEPATTGLPSVCGPARLAPTHRGEADRADLEVDPALTTRVLRDLWRAAHLAPAPAEVHVELRRVGPWHELRVVRLGEPVPVPRLQALFEPFALDDDGTGVTIGLYLARAIAVSLGGAVGAEQDDRRTVLWVRLPSDPDASAVTDLATARSDDDEDDHDLQTGLW